MQVLTENGFKNFIGIRKSVAKEIYHIEFDDGSHLDATKDHRLKRDNDQFDTIGNCRSGQRLSTGRVI